MNSEQWIDLIERGEVIFKGPKEKFGEAALERAEVAMQPAEGSIHASLIKHNVLYVDFLLPPKPLDSAEQARRHTVSLDARKQGRAVAWSNPPYDTFELIPQSMSGNRCRLVLKIERDFKTLAAGPDRYMLLRQVAKLIAALHADGYIEDLDRPASAPVAVEPTAEPLGDVARDILIGNMAEKERERFELYKKITDAITAGKEIVATCGLEGIDTSTYRRWRKKFERLYP